MRAADFLSPTAHQLLDNLQAADPLRAEYVEARVAQIEGFADPGLSAGLGDRLYQALIPLYRAQVGAPFVTRVGERDVLWPGLRFARMDPTIPGVDEAEKAAMYQAFAETGLTVLGDELGATLEPLIRHIADKDVAYQYTYCFLYQEGDYIGPHNDASTGERINVQFPIALDAAAGLRAVVGDAFRLYPDTPGCLRILGPEVWHEVLPVMRVLKDATPRRVLISLRFR